LEVQLVVLIARLGELLARDQSREELDERAPIQALMLAQLQIGVKKEALQQKVVVPRASQPEGGSREVLVASSGLAAQRE
jgi:hypothetical protein